MPLMIATSARWPQRRSPQRVSDRRAVRRAGAVIAMCQRCAPLSSARVRPMPVRIDQAAGASLTGVTAKLAPTLVFEVVAAVRLAVVADRVVEHAVPLKSAAGVNTMAVDDRHRAADRVADRRHRWRLAGFLAGPMVICRQRCENEIVQAPGCLPSTSGQNLRHRQGRVVDRRQSKRAAGNRRRAASETSGRKFADASSSLKPAKHVQVTLPLTTSAPRSASSGWSPSAASPSASVARQPEDRHAAIGIGAAVLGDRRQRQEHRPGLSGVSLTGAILTVTVAVASAALAVARRLRKANVSGPRQFAAGLWAIAPLSVAVTGHRGWRCQRRLRCSVSRRRDCRRRSP